MVTVEDYGKVRRAHHNGMSINELARTFHHSKRKIRQILAEPQPRRYAQRPPAPSIIDPFKPIIDAILKADETAPRKQRHTASKLFRRLRDEHGYSGGAERVRLYIRAVEQRHVETFIPLDHDPGQRLEADFGLIHVDFPLGRQKVPVLVTTWGYSNCPFAIALPTQRTEAILHGLVEAFAFFGCCPRELWWDNPTTVATHLFKGRLRQLHERYAALASHCCFEPLFCLVRTPQEKPHVEGRVKFLQRDWATPVPMMADLAALNVYLRGCCERDRDRTQAGQSETIGARFRRDAAAALPLPPQPFDACLRQPAKVDKYQTVRFDNNGYSVPRSFAFTTVTVKGYVHEVAVLAGAQEIARHPRSYASGVQVLDPLHYLATLGRRPAALDHANVFRHWHLPEVFAELRQDLETRLGALAGARQYIRVLQLLAQHPVDRVTAAIHRSHGATGFDVHAILRRVEEPAAPAPAPTQEHAAAAAVQTESESMAGEAAAVSAADLPAAARGVRVPLPDVRQFDQLLSLKESHERAELPTGESEPQTTAAASDGGGVRPAGPRSSGQ